PVGSAKDWQAAKEHASKILANVTHIVDTDEERKLVKDSVQAYDDFVRIYESEMLPLLKNKQSNAEAITAIDDKLDAKVASLAENMNKITASLERESIEADEGFDSVRKTAITIMLIFGMTTVVIALSVGLGITRNVLRQLGGDPTEVARVVNTMADGDFTQHATHTLVTGSLLADAFRMQSNLSTMISKIKLQSSSVGDMANSLASSARQIATNVDQESDSVSSMAAAIEELSVATTEINSRGSNAKRVASDSQNSANQGAQVVDKSVSGLMMTANEIKNASSEVSRLGEDASRITDVVKVIREIADQTNLLALNAAIEAARAGEQGRGFAVVADEVRKLAERTANSTNEITAMSTKISDAVSHALEGMSKVVQSTQQGVADAELAQTAIASIKQGFGEVVHMIDEMSLSLAEQNVAATDLAKNTELVAQMSEGNSSAAQNLLALANQLESEAGEVRAAVGVFKV
ncbi:MAG: methyl-accepting chemotaxis protein, partial [Gallionellaceae bacterium]|nr:methyl-accepting chemotaxis protein [Gallionellaceae bacterium]